MGFIWQRVQYECYPRIFRVEIYYPHFCRVFSLHHAYVSTAQFFCLFLYFQFDCLSNEWNKCEQDFVEVVYMSLRNRKAINFYSVLDKKRNLLTALNIVKVFTINASTNFYLFIFHIQLSHLFYCYDNIYSLVRASGDLCVSKYTPKWNTPYHSFIPTTRIV